MDEMYDRNLEQISELVIWRRLFRIPAGSYFDRAVAYIIHVLVLKYPKNWKRELDAIKERMISLGYPKYLGYLGELVSSIFIAYFDKDFPSKDKTEALIALRNYHTQQIGKCKEAQKAGKEIRFVAVPDEFLPDWYFIAMPENSRYQKHFVRLEPLRKKGPKVPPTDDETTLSKRITNFKALKYNFEHRSFQPKYVAILKELVDKLGNLITEEYALRDELADAATETKRTEILATIKKCIDNQLTQIAFIKEKLDNNLQIIPDPKTTQDIAMLIVEIIKDLGSEKKRHS
ncbi:hypothetical protein KY310_04190 [Candidatus Woesearchaeota archaeon]|nr:hypothetical protein [Candidatus Woesearchaeota archaeon]